MVRAPTAGVATAHIELQIRRDVEADLTEGRQRAGRIGALEIVVIGNAETGKTDEELVGRQ
jgi:hypothetical protein